MSRPKKKQPKPITFTLTPAQMRDLKKRGLLKNNSRGTLMVRYRAGKLHVIKHKKKGGSFVSSNAAFAPEP